jgi:predicted alpha/beta superfamily hydrolase
MKFLFQLSLILFCCFFISCKPNVKNKEEVREIKSTKANNVHMLDTIFQIKEISNQPKKVWIYLPPDYTTSNTSYPVIYMHDGQNLFDDSTSFLGEWNVDETLNRLFKETGKGFIIVAPENGGNDRINEYTPWMHTKHGGGKGDAYIKFIKNTLKPFIDSNYRTQPEAANTGLIGSSLGGLISYYGGLAYPETFGKLGVLSPSFWFSEEVIPFTKEKGPNSPAKIYFLLGEKEGMTKEFNATIELLKNTGFPEKQFHKKIVPNGEHNEKFWKSELLDVIKFLYDI